MQPKKRKNPAGESEGEGGKQKRRRKKDDRKEEEETARGGERRRLNNRENKEEDEGLVSCWILTSRQAHWVTSSGRGRKMRVKMNEVKVGDELTSQQKKKKWRERATRPRNAGQPINKRKETRARACYETPKCGSTLQTWQCCTTNSAGQNHNPVAFHAAASFERAGERGEGG